MESFEEIRKLEDMEIGAEQHLDELGAFALPKFSVYESNADRLDLFDAAIQRQSAYFFTRAGILSGHLHALALTEALKKADRFFKAADIYQYVFSTELRLPD